MLKIAIVQKKFKSLVTAYRSGKLDMSMITPALAAKIKNTTKGIKIKPSKDMAKHSAAVSKSQQRFMGAVSAYKSGDLDISKVSPEFASKIKKAAKGMTKGEVDDFAETKHKGLPEKVAHVFAKKATYDWIKSEYLPVFGHGNVLRREQKERWVSSDSNKARFDLSSVPCSEEKVVVKSVNMRAPLLIRLLNRMGK